MLITTAFASCTHESEDLNNLPGKNLKVSFNVAEVQSRAILNEASLPTASVVGAKLDGYDNYSSITFTANGTGQAQTWTPNTDVVLSKDQGTLYTYFPYSQDTDISAISVDMTAADQTDWLYGTPVTGVSEDKADVMVTLNHALANINLTLTKGSYVGTGNVSAISVKSDGIAPKGTFNAAQATPGYSAFEDEGTAIGRAVTTTLGGTATDIMVVPTGQSAAITFNVIVDGTIYTATSSAVQLEMGNSYKYTLTLNSTIMGVSEVAVTQWNPVTKDNQTLETVKSDPIVNSAGKANGVYAVTATGELIAYNDAAVDATCLGVALITNRQKIMIEKMGEANAEWNGNTGLYWGKNLLGKNVKDITEAPMESYAKTDFNGLDNSNAIIAAYTEHSVAMDAGDMCCVLLIFNVGDNNDGYSDWYIPAAAQLYEIYTNMAEINEALSAMTATQLNSGSYWSSSMYNANSGWYVNFNDGRISNNSKDRNFLRVRFVRDI